MASLVTPGRVLILLANLFVSPGAYLADWNETHIHNPTWPPHARFHNGQTMSLGVCLAATSLYFAFKPAFSKQSMSDSRESLLYSALIGSYYCFAGLTAIFYPGTDWYDPPQTPASPQKWMFSTQIAVVWLGCWLEIRRLEKTKAA